MICPIPREVLETTPMNDGLVRLLDYMDQEGEAGLKARRAYVALRMIQTRFSRAPQSVPEFKIRLSMEAAQALLEYAGYLGYLDWESSLGDYLHAAIVQEEEQNASEEETERPPGRPTTRASRGYGFRR